MRQSRTIVRPNLHNNIMKQLCQKINCNSTSSPAMIPKSNQFVAPNYYYMLFDKEFTSNYKNATNDYEIFKVCRDTLLRIIEKYDMHRELRVVQGYFDSFLLETFQFINKQDNKPSADKEIEEQIHDIKQKMESERKSLYELVKCTSEVNNDINEENEGLKNHRSELISECQEKVTSERLDSAHICFLQNDIDRNTEVRKKKEEYFCELKEQYSNIEQKIKDCESNIEDLLNKLFDLRGQHSGLSMNVYNLVKEIDHLDESTFNKRVEIEKYLLYVESIKDKDYLKNFIYQNLPKNEK